MRRSPIADRHDADLSVGALDPQCQDHRGRKQGWPNQSVAACKNQFRQDNLPFLAAKLVVVIFVPVLFAPVENRCDLAAQEGGTLELSESTGEASKRTALGVLDPPAVAVAGKPNRITRAGGGDGGY